MKSFLIFLFLINFSYEQICRFDDGDTFIDLTPLNSKIFQALKQEDRFENGSTIIEYYFSPCNDTTQLIPNGTYQTDECTRLGYSLCNVTSEINLKIVNSSVVVEKINQKQELLGRATDGKISVQNGVAYLTYKQTPIELVCTPAGPNQETNFVETFPNKLILYSPNACFLQHHTDSAHSVGAILLLILGIAMLVYFVGGYFFKYFAFGFRGVEAFPHHEFWTGLPSLVRDGITFLQNGCRPSQTQDSYESI